VKTILHEKKVHETSPAKQSTQSGQSYRPAATNNNIVFARWVDIQNGSVTNMLITTTMGGFNEQKENDFDN